MNKKIIPVIIAAIAAMALLLGGCTENPDLAKYTGSTVSETGYTVSESGDFKYNVYDDHAELVGYSGSSRSVNVPASAEGKAVTSIGEGAFSNSNITEVTIPASVKDIGAYAFYNSKLASVTIPEGIEALGYASFGKCTALTSVTVPKTVTRLGFYAFQGCNGLT